jgi:hypothetical protein
MSAWIGVDLDGMTVPTESNLTLANGAIEK